MPLRRRRPLLRAAVVGGGAYVAGKRHARRSAEQEQSEATQDQRISDLEDSPPAGTAAGQAEPGGGSGGPMVDQLSQLSTLHQQGALTDAEFASAKAKLLGT